jgi:hypothetical protein
LKFTDGELLNFGTLTGEPDKSKIAEFLATKARR